MDVSNNKLMQKFCEISEIIADNRYISAISKGISSMIPFTMVVAVFSIVANPPVTAELIAKGGLWTILKPWFDFATMYKNQILAPANLINALFAVIANYNIAYQLASYYKQNTKITSILSVVGFILVAGPLVDGGINTSYLGAQGLFVGIILAIVAVEIVHFCEAKNVVIRLPKSVPPIVSSSFSAIIPLFLTVAIFYALTLVLGSTMNMTLPAAIMKLITPALDKVNTVPVIMLVSILALVLWCLGIHGTAISWAVLGPILMQAVATNGDLVAQGLSPVFEPVLLYTFVSCGGTGCVIALSILCNKAKSQQLKAIGKASIIPSIFSITEPITFGAPIIYNPLLMIPFILVPVVNMILGYLLMVTGILPLPYLGVWVLMPVGVGEFLKSMNIISFIVAWAMVALGGLIYYPFFKAYDNQLYTAERNSENK